MKTVIFGAGGEIGARIIQSFLSGKEDVRAISRKIVPRLARWREIDFVSLELPASKETLRKAMANCDAVVNCVVDKKPFENDDASIQSNVAGLKVLLDVSIELEVKKFIQLSSIAVLPPRLSQEFVKSPYQYSTENDWYTRVKIETEKVALQYQDKLNLCVLRPGIVYGPYMHWSRLAFSRVQNFRLIVPAVEGNVCHAIHVDDLVAQIRHLLKFNGDLPSLVYGINNEVISWKDFFEKHASALGYYELVHEKTVHEILAVHRDRMLAEKGSGSWEILLERLRGYYRKLPAGLIGLPIIRMVVDVMKVAKRGLPFYTQLYLPPPNESFYPNEFELELFSSTALFPEELIGAATGFSYTTSFAEGVRMAAAWRNFELI